MDYYSELMAKVKRSPQSSVRWRRVARRGINIGFQAEVQKLERLTIRLSSARMLASSSTTGENLERHLQGEQRPASGRYLVFYDGQCEICQGCVSWLRAFDRKGETCCIAISDAAIAGLPLELDKCLRQLHVVTPAGEVLVGWDAVAFLALLFRPTCPIGFLGRHFPFRQLGRAIYGWVARYRYSLSKCRGGACKVASPEAVRRTAQLGTFWSCYSLGFLIRVPLVVFAGIRAAWQRTCLFLRAYNRRYVLLDGKLTVFCLNGLLPNLVPLLFGELFTMLLYKGVAIDPGSPKMRRSLARHLRRAKPQIIAVAATHAHEEHVGNLNWVADNTGVPLFVSQMTADFLRPFKKLPRVRAAIIGQPPDLAEPFEFLGDTLLTATGSLQVIPAPGHSDDHVVFFDPAEKLLLAGDAFMGSYFATPNPDVDSYRWIATLERLLELDIEILVEGHGQIHTKRPDIRDIPGVVIREDPKKEILEKLHYLRWLREQIEAGVAEGLPIRAIEATCFPWGRRTSWESCATDECIRLLSLGHFSRTELVRSFVRHSGAILPTVYQVRLMKE